MLLVGNLHNNQKRDTFVALEMIVCVCVCDTPGGVTAC